MPDPFFGPQLILFADADVVDEFAERFAHPNLTAILELLEAGQRDGSMRDVDPRFLVPSLVGSCVFFFLSSPIVRRLYGIENVDDDVAREFAEHTAELILNGVSTRARAPA